MVIWILECVPRQNWRTEHALNEVRLAKKTKAIDTKLTQIAQIVFGTRENMAPFYLLVLQGGGGGLCDSMQGVCSRLEISVISHISNCPLPTFPPPWWKECSLLLLWWMNNSTKLTYLSWWFSLQRPWWMGSEPPLNPFVLVRLLEV